MTTPPGSTRDTAPTTEEPSAKEREAPARLSLTQILASALAAVSTTLLLSYFGTAGTIIGAGIASALTVVANYVYTRSIQKTREQLVPVVGKVVQVTTGASVPRDRGATARVVAVPRGTDPTATPEAVDASAGEAAVHRDGDAAPGDAVAAPEPALPSRWLRLVDRYGRGRVLTVTALVLFVLVMGVVLVVELAIGKPISDAVRGQEGAGTSISRTTTPGDGAVKPSPDQPSDGGTLPTDDPSSVPTDGTTTEPAPAPTQEPTDEPTDGSTDSPSPAPVDPTTPDGDTGGTGGTGSDGEGGTGEPSTGTGGTPPGGGMGSGGAGAGDTSGGSAEPTPAPTTSSSA